MISNTLQEAFNKQIVEEIFSANLYLSMSFYLEKEGFDGFSNWMKRRHGPVRWMPSRTLTSTSATSAN